MRTLRHILLGLAAVLLLFSCSGKARIIPRGAMTSIYAEMFLADQCAAVWTRCFFMILSSNATATLSKTSI